MTDASVRSGCNTARSNGSAKYRRVSCQSSVDESLFGSTRCSPNETNNQRNKKNSVGVEKRVSITASDLNRIKDVAQAMGEKSKINNASSFCNEIKPKSTDVGAARKEHMKGLEMMEIEKQRNECNQIQRDRFDRIRKKAQEKVDEQEDIMKLLLACSERAKTFAIRDQQLKDKAERDKQEQDYEQRMILAMEIDRLKEIEAREAEEAQKVKKMIDGRKIIERQIADRHETKLLMEEARDKENREILEQIKMYQLLDEEKARTQREKSARAREEIMRAKEEYINAKREHRLLEKKEDAMMIAHQMVRDVKVQEEAERKKREIQKRLLDKQERTLDRRAEIDELRARRAFEDAERKYRQKQLLEAQKKKQDIEALDIARRQQQQERIDKARREIAEKQEEYENAIKQAHAMAERERAEKEHEKERNTKLITNLQDQIEENRAIKATHEKEKLREGARIKEKLIFEKEKLEAARAKMIEDMKMNGIDERYFGEIMSLDINKFLMK